MRYRARTHLVAAKSRAYSPKNYYRLLFCLEFGDWDFSVTWLGYLQNRVSFQSTRRFHFDFFIDSLSNQRLA